MNILAVYARYRIPSHLQLHMLRVSAVAEYLMEHWHGPDVDQRLIIETLLVHDLGNLMKMDLNSALGMRFFDSDEKDKPYWLKVQKQMRRFGTNSDEVTLSILAEIQANENVIRLVRTMTGKAMVEKQTPEIAHQLCWYADMRVGPQGVMSIEERMTDLIDRYAHRDAEWSDPEKIAILRQRRLEIENALLSQTDVSAPMLTNETLAPIVERLRHWDFRSGKFG